VHEVDTLISGLKAPACPPLALRLLVERRGVAVRVGDGGLAFVGERVFFRAYTLVGDEVSLSVAGPEREETLRTEGGLLTYEFDTPGDYTFSLSSLSSLFSPRGAGELSSVTIEVR